jgi:hypothetical protein
MDYSLKSLRDAFEDAEYKRSRRGYELYALLLATSLDHDLVLQYLSLFHELDVLTGDRVLVMGPHLGSIDDEPHSEVPRLRSSDLNGILNVIRHDPMEHYATSPRSILAAERFLSFMQEQTRESYSIARYLGIPTNSMPLFVFFDNLDAPHDRVEWSLQDKSGRDVVRDLRRLLRAVSDDCGWDLHQRRSFIDQSVKALQRLYSFSRDVPYELRTEWEAWHNASEEERPISELTAYYRRLAKLRLAYDQACAGQVRIPLENIGETIAKLETGRVDEDLFSHLDKHYRRWKSRMPAEYREALRQVYRPHVSAYVHNGQLTLVPEDATRNEHHLQEVVRQLKDAYESKRRQLCADAEASLARVDEEIARPKPPPLRVIQNVLRNAAKAVNEPNRPNDFRAVIREPPARAG